MRKVMALARGIIKNMTVSKNTGIPKKKLPKRKANGALSTPVNFNKDRMIRSAAPDSNMHFPMMAAMAINMPILAQVLPNSVAIRSPTLFLENDNAAPASMPLERANCSKIVAGVKRATTKAPNKRAKKGWSFKPMMPPTTKTMPMANKIIGSNIMILEI